MIIRAIETRYKGYRFRSRLEARWAVFYDALGIAWEYEKQGFDLDSGKYLPDFWMPDLKCWIELKGEDATDKEKLLAGQLADGTGSVVYIFPGEIFMPRDEYPYVPAAYYLSGVGIIDYPYLWCCCPNCRSFGIQFEGRSDRLRCKEPYKEMPNPSGCPRAGGNRDKGYNVSPYPLAKAYQAALSARFEHGECGTGRRWR